MKISEFIKTLKILIELKYVLILMILLGCKIESTKELNTEQVPLDLKGSIVITGAEALCPLMKIWAQEFTKDQPNLEILVQDKGSGKGLADLLSGKADLAMVSRSLSPAEEAIGFWYLTVSKEGVIPIINSKNPYLPEILTKGIKRTTLIELFTSGKTITWGEILEIEKTEAVKIFIRSDNTGTAEVWAKYLGKEQKDLVGIPVTSYEHIVGAVIQHPFSLSFCNARDAYLFNKKQIHKGLSIIPIDFNNNGRIDSKERFYEDLCMVERAASLGKYPSHLCRELYLVSIEKPTKPEIINFFKWIYTDGQKIAAEVGYAHLTSCKTRELIAILDELEN